VAITIKVAPHALTERLTAMIFLQTERLTLRDYVASDWRDIVRLHTDPDVVRYLVDAVPTTPLETGAFINVIKKMRIESPALGVWRAGTCGDDNFVGNFSLMPLAGTDDIEIGARLLKQAWGAGYSIECGLALLQYAFDELKLPRVVSMCHPDNRAAAQSLIALGFSRHGIGQHYGRELPFFVIAAAHWREQASLGLSWRAQARMNLRAARRPM
jgi:[ribosomal protein S5]-alanine N-acetyltransferase